ncbi:hypothetical protein [Pseudomonas fluorescens]|uniref:hypothetical protein n=1 Tax=Pseudomonas fluorescens TaxID=294 RepID=UPI0012421163|nr:hypothetical protein [Pseudomonas fluorescens]
MFSLLNAVIFESGESEDTPFVGTGISYRWHAFFQSVYQRHLANGWRGIEADEMSAKPDALEAEPPVIDSPKNRDATGIHFSVNGTGTPGNVVVAYSTKDPLNPLFGQLVGDEGNWRTFLDLSRFSFYVVEKTREGKVVSPPSPTVTINLKPVVAAPYGEAPVADNSEA